MTGLDAVSWLTPACVDRKALNRSERLLRARSLSVFQPRVLLTWDVVKPDRRVQEQRVAGLVEDALAKGVAGHWAAASVARLGTRGGALPIPTRVEGPVGSQAGTGRAPVERGRDRVIADPAIRGVKAEGGLVADPLQDEEAGHPVEDRAAVVPGDRVPNAGLTQPLGDLVEEVRRGEQEGRPGDRDGVRPGRCVVGQTVPRATRPAR